MSDFTERTQQLAKFYIESGFKIFPVYGTVDGKCKCGKAECTNEGKHPIYKYVKHGHLDATDDLKMIPKWFSNDNNIGIPTGKETNLAVLDVDMPDGPVSLKILTEKYDPLPEDTPYVKTGGGGIQYFFKYPEGCQRIRSQAKRIIKDENAEGDDRFYIDLDSRGNGGYVVAPPSLHKSGNEYRWAISPDVNLKDRPVMPQWLVDVINYTGEQPRKSAKGNTVAEIVKEPGRNDYLTRKAGGLRAIGLDTESRFEALMSFNTRVCVPPLPEKDVRRISDGMDRYPRREKKRPLTMFPRTDAGAAEMLAETHGEKLRFCYGKGWLYYDGKCWSLKRGEEMARRSCVQSARQLRKEALGLEGKDREAVEKYARQLENSNRITSTLKEAAHTPPFASYADSYDTDNFAFNCLNGTIDLRTGILRDHCPEDMITICAPVRFDPDAKNELWTKTLLEIFQDDLVLIRYVQRVFGMCLTGDVREHILAILYGPEGRNGKDTVLDAIRGVMGDYAGEAATSLLVSKKGFDEHPTEIADLCGKRLVIGSETAENGKLKAATVKRLTGTKRVKGRFMRQDFFEFDRTFKIMLCTNHRPDVGENTTAIWSRLKIIPFNRVFAESEQDKRLGDKLMSEYPGVLNWLIAGCREWQANGLQEPDAVGNAVAEYKSSQNPLRDFIDEMCVKGEDLFIAVTEFRGHFNTYAIISGLEGTISAREFNGFMRGCGFSEGSKRNHGKVVKSWLGIGLANDNVDEDDMSI